MTAGHGRVILLVMTKPAATTPTPTVAHGAHQPGVHLLPTCPAEVPAYLETAIVENGARAWVEVVWLYRYADTGELHSFVEQAARHVAMRDLWLGDPDRACDLTHEVITADLYAYGENRAGCEACALRDLINAWVREHALTAVSL